MTPKAWTDERLDDLSDRVDRGFEQVDRRFEQVDRHFEQVDVRFEQVDRRFIELDRSFDHLDQEMRFLKTELAGFRAGSDRNFNTLRASTDSKFDAIQSLLVRFGTGIMLTILAAALAGILRSG